MNFKEFLRVFVQAVGAAVRCKQLLCQRSSGCCMLSCHVAVACVRECSPAGLCCCRAYVVCRQADVLVRYDAPCSCGSLLV